MEFELVAFIREGTKPVYSNIRVHEIKDEYSRDGLRKMHIEYWTPGFVREENCYDWNTETKTFVRRRK